MHKRALPGTEGALKPDLVQPSCDKKFLIGAHTTRRAGYQLCNSPSIRECQKQAVTKSFQQDQLGFMSDSLLVPVSKQTPVLGFLQSSKDMID